MVFGVRSRHEGEAAEQAMEERVRNVAAFPLAIPLLAGPGAITATVLLAGQADGDWLRVGILVVVVLLVAASCLVTFLGAERISGLLGMTGNIVLSRLLGVLLAALSGPIRRRRHPQHHRRGRPHLNSEDYPSRHHPADFFTSQHCAVFLPTSCATFLDVF